LANSFEGFGFETTLIVSTKQITRPNWRGPIADIRARCSIGQSGLLEAIRCIPARSSVPDVFFADLAAFAGFQVNVRFCTRRRSSKRNYVKLVA
jgi:hypothetical protein